MARDDIRTRLRAAKPGLSHRHDPLSERALAELEQFELMARTSPAAPAKTSDERAPRRRPRLVLGSLAMAVVVLVAALATWVSMRPEPALAITPAPLHIQSTTGTARDTLMALAGKRLADTGSDTGAQESLRSYQWALESSVADDGSVTSTQSVPQQRTLTFGPDGAVTLVARAAAPFPNEIRTGLPAEGTVLDKEHWAPGKYDNPYAAAPPTNASAMKGYFAKALGVDELTAGDYVRAVGDLISSRPINAAQESAILQLLAGQRTLRLAGTTTDRLGRAGDVFVAKDRRPGEYEDMLVVAPDTGRILAVESVYTGHDRTDIPSPATTTYTAWVR